MDVISLPSPCNESSQHFKATFKKTRDEFINLTINEINKMWEQNTHVGNVQLNSLTLPY